MHVLLLQCLSGVLMENKMCKMNTVLMENGIREMHNFSWMPARTCILRLYCLQVAGNAQISPFH